MHIIDIIWQPIEVFKHCSSLTKELPLDVGKRCIIIQNYYDIMLIMAEKQKEYNSCNILEIFSNS